MHDTTTVVSPATGGEARELHGHSVCVPAQEEGTPLKYEDRSCFLAKGCLLDVGFVIVGARAGAWFRR